MKKYLVLALLAVLATGWAKATVLFPFYTDLSTDAKMIVRMVDDRLEQVMHKGSSSWGGMTDCASFLDDVVPEDVCKTTMGDSMVVYVSPFHAKEVDTIETENKVCAIYLLKRKDRVDIYYTESSALQQKKWQEEIAAGMFDSQTELTEIKAGTKQQTACLNMLESFSKKIS